MAKQRKKLDIVPKTTSSIQNQEPKISALSIVSGDTINDCKIIITPTERFTEEEQRQIQMICHKHKNLLLSGYSHGRKTRKQIANDGYKYLRADTPGVCLTYLLKTDDESGKIEIKTLVSNEAKVLDRYPEEKLLVIIQNWQQNVSDDILAIFA